MPYARSMSFRLGCESWFRDMSRTNSKSTNRAGSEAVLEVLEGCWSALRSYPPEAEIHRRKIVEQMQELLMLCPEEVRGELAKKYFQH